jgi:peptide/nickel transport system substrate-binding protein
MQTSSYWQRFTTQRLSRRRALRAGAAGLGATALLFAGCGGDEEEKGEGGVTPSAQETPQSGGKITFGLISDPGGLDEQELVTSYWVTSNFNGFLHFINLRTQEMMLHMADSFEQPDTTTYIWKLKPGIKFHNIEPTFGREVTADDCVYSFTRRRDDPTVQNDKQLLRDFTEGWEAVDQYTFRLRTKQPYRPAIDEIANSSYPIVPKEAVEKYGDLMSHPVGCGAYIMTEFRRSELVRMKKNPDYFMPGRPYTDEREWQIVLDSSTLLQMFKTGQHDYNGSNLDKLKVEEIQKDMDHVTVLKVPNFWRHTFLLRVDQPPFQDKRVWEAIDLIVDRQDLIDKMAFGEGVYTGPVAATLEPYSLPQDELRDFYQVDLTKAKQLLSAAGFADGLEFDAPLENVVDLSKCAEVVKEQLSKAGVNMKIQPVELAGYLARNLYGRDFQGTWYYNLQYVEPDRPLCQWYSKGQAGFSFSGYSNPAMDAWVEKERAEFDNDKRRQIVLDAQREMIKEHGPQINTYIPQGYVAFRDWVHGIEKTVDIGAWSYLGIDAWVTARP